MRLHLPHILSNDAVIVLLIALVLNALVVIGQYEFTQSVNGQSYARCQDRAANIVQANAFYAGMARLEASNRFIDHKLRNERIALYRGVVYALPNCGAKP